ncbi:HAD family hydrolase [Krasilnikoviella flava]|uniref:Putative hydrolase of the HAD superfamily n=1 Tax=Krasilnikoviella flava TaxID=526729 RepID=A0A1T5L913_9MICO|nr:HAD family hydrolase [Krasilnikoviella flava]SKC72471.1 putative hydrolase of the HAD superfamily [Krasilnikoviella flava]
MIWLFDLDNTLVGRDDAFAAWAATAVADAGRGPDDLAAIVAADQGGFGSKAALARELIDRLGWADDVPAGIERFRGGILEHVRAYDGVLFSLDVLRGAGHRVAVVTNGTSAQQRGKVARCGLETHVDAVVVSEEEGVAKPDPRIVEIALDRLGAADVDRHQVWMVGDAAHADVAVGRAAGTRTAWVSHGRSWDGPDRPDVVAATTREAIARAASPAVRSR